MQDPYPSFLLWNSQHLEWRLAPGRCLICTHSMGKKKSIQQVMTSLWEQKSPDYTIWKGVDVGRKSMNYEVSYAFVKILVNILAWISSSLFLTVVSCKMEIVTTLQNHCECKSETIFKISINYFKYKLYLKYEHMTYHRGCLNKYGFPTLPGSLWPCLGEDFVC